LNAHVLFTRCKETNAKKNILPLVIATIATNQVEKVGGFFEAKTPIDVYMEVFSDSIEEEEEDLVRFQDIMNAASHTTDSLETLKLSCNVTKSN